MTTARDPGDRSTGWPALHDMIEIARRDRLETLRVAPLKRALAAERELCDQLAAALTDLAGVYAWSADALTAIGRYNRNRGTT